jgi:hypothetical protein
MKNVAHKALSLWEMPTVTVDLETKSDSHFLSEVDESLRIKASIANDMRK